MEIAAPALLWVTGLVAALYGAEKLVQVLSTLGATIGLSTGLLGLLVALGADGPEVTSAFIALAGGSQDIGLGVVVGSNIYNLAGLLGLAALVARGVTSTNHRLVVDGGLNLVLTVILLLLLQRPDVHLVLGGLLVALLVVYVVVETYPRIEVSGLFGSDTVAFTPADSPETPVRPAPSIRIALVLIALSVGSILGGSAFLVNASIRLAPKLAISTTILGTFILPIATSLPNTWAAISLARKNLASTAVAATFHSNSINIAIGAGIPALFLTLHASRAVQTLDAGWLLGMTAIAIALLAARRTLAHWEGAVLLALYAAFVVLRLTLAF